MVIINAELHPMQREKIETGFLRTGEKRSWPWGR